MNQLGLCSIFKVLATVLVLTHVKTINAAPKCYDLFGISVSKQDIFLSENQKKIKNDFEDYDPQFKLELGQGLYKFIQAAHEEGAAGERKLNLLSSLGFKIGSLQAEAPTFSEFTKLYVQKLNFLNIAEQSRILPAIAIGTISAQGRFQNHEVFTPGTDQWPHLQKFSAYQIVDKSDFNLPSAAVLKAQSRGRYPLLPAMHDVFHYLTFIEHPNYANALRQAASRLKKESDAVNEKFNFLNEVLSLPNLSKKNEILNSLIATRGDPLGERYSYSYFERYFENMSEADMLQAAKSLAVRFPMYLIDIGGAIYNPSEKKYLFQIAGSKAISISKDDVSERYGNSDLAFAAPATFGHTLHALVNFIEKPTEFSASIYAPSRADITMQLRKRLAATEYYLWYFTTKNTTPENFVSRFILQDGSTDPELREALQKIWGPRSVFSKLIFRNEPIKSF